MDSINDHRPPSKQHIECDVAIIGAGPIGGRVAELLASKGVAVRLIEEHHGLGWPVQCAGLVTPRVFDVITDRSSIQKEIFGARIFSPAGYEIEIKAKDPRAVVVDRTIFDRNIVKAAICAGTKLYLGTKALRASRSGNRVKIVVDHCGKQAWLTSKLLIGCDGVQSQVAQWFALPSPKRLLAGFQAELSGASLEHVSGESMVRMYTGCEVAPGFFAWLIPTGKSVLLGLCITPEGMQTRGNRSQDVHGTTGYMHGQAVYGYYRKLFHHPLLQPLLANASPLRFMAGGIPIGPLKRTYADNVMIVGDAAAQAKPTSGGGIYTGLRCAEHCAAAAVRAIEEGDYSAKQLAVYQKQWEHELGDELKKGWRLHQAYLNLDDRKLEDAFKILDDPKILSIISAVGDIDHPSKLANVLFKKIPKLLKFAGPYLKTYFQ